MLQLLEKHEIVRPPNLTPMEFSRSITFVPSNVYDMVQRITQKCSIAFATAGHNSHPPNRVDVDGHRKDRALARNLNRQKIVAKTRSRAKIATRLHCLRELRRGASSRQCFSILSMKRKRPARFLAGR